MQLRNLTRRHLPQNPKNDMNTSDGFVDLILKGHVLSATMAVLEIKDFDEVSVFLPANLSHDSSSKKKSFGVYSQESPR